MTNILPFGSIRKVTTPANIKSGPTVLLIQDVHLNPEAQTNISKAVKTLIDEKQVDLVALEGLFSPVDFSFFNRYPRPDAVKAVADYLLREKKISGAAYAGYTAASAPLYAGIDDRVHYDANVEAYKQVVSFMESYREKIRRRQMTTRREKNRTFNRGLAKFDARVEAYRAGSLPLAGFVQLFERDTVSPPVAAFLETSRLEKNLDFKRVESERTALINKLTARLSRKETDELIKWTVAYRVGNVTHTDFYGYIKKLCARCRVDLSAYKTMGAYVRYLLLSDTLDVEAVMTDIKGLEQNHYEALCRTNRERKLVQMSRALYLAGKLVEFALTSGEWEEYKTGENRKSRIDQGIINFEAFYREAETRDEKMADNLIKGIRKSSDGRKLTVLVTGGFHAAGITERLKQAGITTISFVPKITKIDNATGSSYLNAFTQRKTPLDKLFAGEKLFVTPRPMVNFGPFQALISAYENALARFTSVGNFAISGVLYTVVLGAGGIIVDASAHIELPSPNIFYGQLAMLTSYAGAFIGVLLFAAFLLHPPRKDDPRVESYTQLRHVAIIFGLGAVFLLNATILIGNWHGDYGITMALIYDAITALVYVFYRIRFRSALKQEPLVEKRSIRFYSSLAIGALLIAMLLPWLLHPIVLGIILGVGAGGLGVLGWNWAFWWKRVLKEANGINPATNGNGHGTQPSSEQRMRQEDPYTTARRHAYEDEPENQTNGHAAMTAPDWDAAKTTYSHPDVITLKSSLIEFERLLKGTSSLSEIQDAAVVIDQLLRIRLAESAFVDGFIRECWDVIVEWVRYPIGTFAVKEMQRILKAMDDKLSSLSEPDFWLQAIAKHIVNAFHDNDMAQLLHVGPAETFLALNDRDQEEVLNRVRAELLVSPLSESLSAEQARERLFRNTPGSHWATARAERSFALAAVIRLGT